MQTFLHHFVLAAPLFTLALAGYALARWGGWSQGVSDALAKFVFGVALPAFLFRLMSDLSKLPPVDARLLIAFFGSCLLVFAVGRVVAAKLFHLDGVSQSVFALGGVFSNNVLLGIPLAKVSLGETALPSVALVLVFNSLILWTLVTVSVEWARHGELSVHGMKNTAKGVLTNPIVVSILSGTLVGVSGVTLPTVVSTPLDMVATSATPLALVALGMSLGGYGLRVGWRQSLAIAGLKLLLQPLMIWGLALALGLPKMETRAIVLLGSIATGANVYLMSKQFKVMEGPVASAVLLTTTLSAVTAPLFLSLTA